MANICDTQLSIQHELSEEKGAEFSKQFKTWLDENYDYNGDVHIDWEDENLIEVTAQTRWNVQEEILQRFCKEFGVKVRAIGQENGCAFVQVVCVDENGEIVQNESIGFNF